MNIRKILLIVVLIIIYSCTSDNDFIKAKQQLEAQGYSDIEDTGYNWFCCDEKDSFSTGFIAKDSNGNKVEGCICSGVMKGITIRFE